MSTAVNPVVCVNVTWRVASESALCLYWSHFYLLRCHLECLLLFWHVKCHLVLLNCMTHNMGIVFNMKPTMKWKLYGSLPLRCICSPTKIKLLLKIDVVQCLYWTLSLCGQSPLNVGLGVNSYYVHWTSSFQNKCNAINRQNARIQRYICGIAFEQEVFFFFFGNAICIVKY